MIDNNKRVPAKRDIGLTQYWMRRKLPLPNVIEPFPYSNIVLLVGAQSRSKFALALRYVALSLLYFALARLDGGQSRLYVAPTRS